MAVLGRIIRRFVVANVYEWAGYCWWGREGVGDGCGGRCDLPKKETF